MEIAKYQKKLYDNPKIRKSLFDAVNRGVSLEAIIHRNTSKTLRDLGRSGKIKLFYTPNELEVSTMVADDNFIMSEVDEVYDEVCNYIFPENRYEAAGARKKFEKMKKYLIAPEEVDEVFTMIDTSIDSHKIVEYLTRQK